MGGSNGVNRKIPPPPLGTLLQTLVRFCVDSIDPIRDVDVQVSFNWMCEDGANDYAVGNGD